MQKTDGHKLLEFAKKCVHSELFDSKLEIPESIKKFDSKQGIFVTIHKKGELRGCIGYVIGYYPLWEGIRHAANSAAFEDPRFPPINKKEWPDLDFEISILSVPQYIEVDNPKDLPGKITVGSDGLICECQRHQGLLLPQVPLEWNWNAQEFLFHTCEKAGLPGDIWKSGKCRFKKFQAEIFNDEK